MARDTDTRTVTLVDLPLIRRMSDQAQVLSSEIEYTRDVDSPTVPSILLPQRNLHTLVTRSDKQQVVGQFRLEADDQQARIIFIAPTLEQDTDDTVWLHILDAMAREAGRYNAHALVAEVDESHCLFETMRTAGFAVYARQQIWRRLPHTHTLIDTSAYPVEETTPDDPGVQSLIAHTVPSLTQQITAPPEDMSGWVYRKDNRTEAYIAASEGKHGIFLIPYFNPDAMAEVPAVLESVIQQLSRSAKLPVYVCVRRYQDWMGNALDDLQFEPGPRQAVMVRHIAARIRHPVFNKTATQGVPAVATGTLKPPSKIIESNQRSVWNDA